VHKPRAVGAPTSLCKEVQDVQNAIKNPIHSAARKRKREEEAIRMLEEKGFADKILSELEVKEKMDAILGKVRRIFGNKCIIALLNKTKSEQLDFCVGFTEQQIE
jgi:hypothetical protein